MLKKGTLILALILGSIVLSTVIATCTAHSQALLTDPPERTTHIGTLSAIGLTADNAAPPGESFLPDTFVYRVVYRWHGQSCVRIRHDVVRTTVYYNGQPLGYTVSGQTYQALDMSNSDLASLMGTGIVPDTLDVDPRQSITRTEFRQNGTITSGPRLVRGTGVGLVDLDRLMARHLKYAERQRRLATR